MADMASPPVIPVSALNRMVREVLENSFPLLWVAGEISNLTRAASGHWYFSLKDAHAQVRCVMFRNKNMLLDWQPREGDHVEARALVTLYEARGDFQLTVEFLQRAGLGALFEAFERLKAQLEREGLFDAARKRPLPAHPHQIGVVTSPDAAALRDVLITLRRRAPGIPVVIYPTPVQGQAAAAQIASAIRQASARAECDVLIVCRGGGSMEDLWPFNEEAVARAIAACPMPVVSGVGHETDFTIADFVADLRAPTPTAAAELVTPDREALLRQVHLLETRLVRQMRHQIEQRAQRLDYLARRLISPEQRLRLQGEHINHLGARLVGAMILAINRAAARYAALPRRLQTAQAHDLATRAAKLRQLERSLQHLSPHAVLERGYSLVQTPDGQIVRTSAGLQPGAALQLTFAEGRADAQVTRIL